MTLEEQPIPEDTSCPECGDDPTDDSLVEHKLSNMGYLHDDIQLSCDNGHTWSCGVPIGEFDGGDSLICDSCDESWMYVHRVQLSSGDEKILLHLKCPNCKYFEEVEREPDGDGVALVGYPPITGDTVYADSFGYETEALN